MNKINTKLVLATTFVALLSTGMIASILPSSVFAQNNGANGASGGNGGAGGNAECNSAGGVTKGENGGPGIGTNGGNGGNGGSAICHS
jgi:hypothetical protein